MTRTIETKANFSGKDIFNINSAQTLDKSKGQVITVAGCALGTDVSSETGEVINTGFLKDSEGNIYSTISGTAIQSITALIDLFADEGDNATFDVKIDTRKSNAGREFIVLHLM